MDLLREIDGYCERVGPEYWAEPLNAATNLGFVLVAWLMWRRSAGNPMARALSVILAVIGVGSFLFHTHATVWAAIADTVPIGVFILVYMFAVNRDVWGMRPWVAAVVTACFVPYAVLTVPLYQSVPVLNVSAGYVLVPVLILIYAGLLWLRAPILARGFVIGAALLFASLVARSIDATLCAQVPFGTHFLWHILNAIMLGWMIEVYRRYVSET
jgi:ceramidase